MSVTSRALLLPLWTASHFVRSTCVGPESLALFISTGRPGACYFQVRSRREEAAFPRVERRRRKML